MSLPEGRGILATTKFGEVPVELPYLKRAIDPRQGVFEAESFDVPADGLAEVGDGFFFGLAFAVGGEVRHAGGEAAEIGVGNEFDGDLGHESRPQGL